MSLQLKPTRSLPENARLVYTFSLVKNRAALWGFNLAAIPLVIFFAWFFSWFLFQVRPGLAAELPDGQSVNGWLVLFLLLGLTVLQLLVHELVHGLFFWVFTRHKPVFGFRGWFAFAAAPGWYFPRGQYLAIGLAPFVLISLLCMLLLAILPAGPALAGALFAAIANAASSVGDLWFSLRILRERRPLLVEDLGEGFRLHVLS